MSAIDRTNSRTWPVVLSLADMADIYQRTPDAIRHSLKPSFRGVASVPKPFLCRPLRWRKADVERHVMGGRTTTVGAR
jgi:hypothetical protein